MQFTGTTQDSLRCIFAIAYLSRFPRKPCYITTWQHLALYELCHSFANCPTGCRCLGAIYRELVFPISITTNPACMFVDEYGSTMPLLQFFGYAQAVITNIIPTLSLYLLKTNGTAVRSVHHAPKFIAMSTCQTFLSILLTVYALCACPARGLFSHKCSSWPCPSYL